MIPRLATILMIFVCSGVVRGEGEDADAIFQQRIMPIFRSPNPSSCVQCHLSSVDLKDYIRPSHKETFLSLRDQGLVDLKSPGDSKILKLIDMGDKDKDAMAKRIHAKTRKAEYEAFSSWIVACCKDDALVAAPKLDQSQHASPAHSDEVIRHARKDRMLDSFVRNIWSQRMRCFPCHTPDEIDPANPQHVKAGERHAEFVKKYGAKMNIFDGGPEATMRSLITNSRKRSKKHLPMLNVEDPAQSLLVLKPTSKLPPKKEDGTFEKPSSLDPVSHMGGLKMHVDDQSYKAFLAWIEDYARIVHNEYRDSGDLPADNWYPTKHVLRVKQIPESWPVMSRLQLFVHAWDAGNQTWREQPVAFTQGIVTPRRFANGGLFVLKTDPDAKWDVSGETLAGGRYLIKLYLDSEGKLESDPAAFLTESDFKGAIETRGAWGEGFKNAKLVSAAELSNAETSASGE